MTGQPWMKFYPRDWRGDHALRMVSMAARGLWMECICLMHEAKPYGHLVLNGQPVSDDMLSRWAGIPLDQIVTLMSELEKAGVLSRTANGVAYSRRMTKDFQKAKIGSKSAKKRWGQPTEKQQENLVPNRSPNRSPNAQKPEARKKEEERKEENKQQQQSLVVDAASAVACTAAAAQGGRKAELDDIERRLREAAGVENHPGPNFLVLAPILGLIDAGFDLETDILPSLRARRGKGRPNGWSFFVGAIREDREKRMAAGSEPPARKEPAKTHVQRMIDYGWKQSEEHYAKLCAAWFGDHRWPDPDGPRPGQQGSFVPLDFADAWVKSNRKTLNGSGRTPALVR